MIFGPNGKKKFWQAAEISGWAEVIRMCKFNKSRRTVVQHLQALWCGKAHLGRTAVGCEGIIEKRCSFRKARLAFYIITVFMVIAVPVCGLAQVEPEQARKVLVFNSYHRGYDWSDRIMDTIEAELGKTDLKVDLYWEYMDAVRRSLDDAYAYMKKSLETRYRDFGFDLIVSSDDPALHFLLGNRDFLFPGVPIVFCGVQQFEDSKPETHPAVTGVLEVYDWESTVKIALKLHPSATRIVAISHRRREGFLGRSGLDEVIPKLSRRVEFDTFALSDLTMAELLAKVEALGNESVVLLDSASQDREGKTYSLEKSVPLICEHCAAPVYITGFRRLGLGPVGGKLTSGDYQGLVAAKMAIRILNGEDPEGIPIQTQSPNAYMFDYHQLQRFGIAFSVLPEDSIIINQPESSYYHHRRQIWAVVVVIAALIAVVMMLSASVLRRRRAEEALRESEERYKVLFDGSPEGIIVADVETKQFGYANPAICTMLGYTREELGRMTVFDIHPKEHLDHVLSEFDTQVKGEKALAVSIPCLRKDGKVIYADIDSAKVIVDGRECNVGFFTDITERKKTQEELLFKSTLLEAQSETSIDGILVVDDKSKTILFNKRFGQMWDIPQQILDTRDDEKMLQYVLGQLKAPDRFLEKVRYLYTRKSEKSRDEIMFKDGRVFDRYSSPLLHSAGRYYGRVWYFRDVTDRRRAEDALRESQELFNAFMDQLPATAFIKDDKSRVRYANSYMIEHFGADRWIDRTASEYFPPEIAEQVLEHDRKVLSEGASDREEWVPDKGGETRCMHTYKFPIRRKGKPVLLGGVSVDVTEHRRARDALRESRRQQGAILDTIPDIAWLKDKQSRYIAVNEPFGESCGVNPESLVGKTDFDLWPEDLAKKYRDDDKEVMRLRRRKRMVEPLEDSKGKRIWLETIKTPIYDEHGQVVGTSGIGRDITEVKQAQEQLEKAHRELELRVQERTVELENANIDLRKEVGERKKAQEKLIVYQRELRSLASELSLAEERLRRRIATDIHDHVGQKLAISKIKLESLAESVSSAEVAGSLDEIRGLIAEIIKSTRSLTFELSPPVLYELGLEAAVEWLVRQAREQHGLTTEFRNDRRPKPVDNDVRVLLFQAVRELLVNVAKHAHANKVKVSTRRVGDEIRVSVADDGVGFDTSRASSQGYASGGFGLFSIRERMGHIGGYLKIESTPGRGTRISLVAPINHKTRGSEGESR